MSTLRGRAAQPIRPGMVVKGILLGQIPLATGELVTEAAIADLAAAYKELIKRENTLRERSKRLRGMTSFSFKTYFRFAQLLGLVELVREEPMMYPPPGGHLYSVRKPDGVHVVISRRRIFKITILGTQDELSWTNLCKAWREGWPAPQKVEFIPPEEAPPITPPAKPPVELPAEEFAPYRWVSKPSEAQFRSLLKHLKALKAIGIEDLKVSGEVDRLSMLIGDWQLDIEDSLEDAKAIAHTEAVRKLEKWTKAVTGIAEGLMDADLDRSIGALKELVG